MTDPTDDTTRRRFLQAAGVSTAAALAGCASGSSGDGDDTTESDSMDDGTTDTMGEETTDTMGEETTDDMEDGTTEDSMQSGMEPTDPADAPRASIDRFSADAGTLHVRENNPGLPGPDDPIDFDANFLHQGYGPDGDEVEYYDFDVMPTEPAPIYAFFRENGDPVEGQLNVVGTVPGDDGYNDFWQVNKVLVPDEYRANAITSAAALRETDYDIQSTETIKNCPIVPEGSTAEKRHGDATTGTVEGWHDGEVVEYFVFEEASLSASSGSVPLSPIYVTFNKNPGEDGGGPPSGFMTEADSARTHNVIASLPGDDAYSPLWMVNIYDNADFDAVSDFDSATSAEILASGAANVNCPVVSEQ